MVVRAWAVAKSLRLRFRSAIIGKESIVVAWTFRYLDTSSMAEIKPSQRFWTRIRSNVLDVRRAAGLAPSATLVATRMPSPLNRRSGWPLWRSSLDVRPKSPPSRPTWARRLGPFSPSPSSWARNASTLSRPQAIRPPGQSATSLPQLRVPLPAAPHLDPVVESPKCNPPASRLGGFILNGLTLNDLRAG
jgi:hypothetical protein